MIPLQLRALLFEAPHRCSRPTSDRKGTAKCKERPVVVDAEPGDHGMMDLSYCRYKVVPHR